MAAKKKKNSPPMMMKEADVNYRRRLLERWNFTCIICGREFTNLACVTKEHLVPKAFRDRAETLQVEKDNNIAPSHYSCNQIRGVNSLFVAVQSINLKHRQLGDKVFIEWLNRPVPNRVVPMEALEPLRPTRWLRSFELPEWLPGIT